MEKLQFCSQPLKGEAPCNIELPEDALNKLLRQIKWDEAFAEQFRREGKGDESSFYDALATGTEHAIRILTGMSRSEIGDLLKKTQLIEPTRVTLSFETLYKHFEAEEKELTGKYEIWFKEDVKHNQSFYDLVDAVTGEVLGCDGEKWDILNRDEDWVTLRHTEFGTEIQLTPEELNIAAFR